MVLRGWYEGGDEKKEDGSEVEEKPTDAPKKKKVISPEQKKKLSDSMKQYHRENPATPEYRKKISEGLKKHHATTVRSEESRRKAGEKMKKWHSENKHPRSTPIRATSPDGEVFYFSEIQKTAAGLTKLFGIGFSETTVGVCVKEGRKNQKGWKFEKVDV